MKQNATQKISNVSYRIGKISTAKGAQETHVALLVTTSGDKCDTYFFDGARSAAVFESISKPDAKDKFGYCRLGQTELWCLSKESYHNYRVVSAENILQEVQKVYVDVKPKEMWMTRFGYKLDLTSSNKGLLSIDTTKLSDSDPFEEEIIALVKLAKIKGQLSSSFFVARMQ